MAEMSFREQNRRRREQNAFENLYAYAKDRGIPDPKRTAERAARVIHADGTNGSRPRTRSTQSEANASGAETTRKTPHRLDERTKDELYERAQELDIEGRSKMTKDELIDAIRAQQ